MSRFPVFAKMLRDQRIPLASWSAAMFLLALVHVLTYPEYKEAASALSEFDYYQALAGEAGGIGTPGGYINAEFFTAAPLMVLIFAIIAGVGSVAGEEGAGTLDLVLAQPVRRRRLVAEKAAALAVLVTVASMASLPGLYLGSLLVDFDLAASRMAWACLTMAPLSLLYASVAMLCSAILPGRTGSTVAIISMAIAAFFLKIFGAFVSELDQVQKISPFYWSNYGKALTGDFEWLNAAGFAGLSALVVVLAMFALERRDLSAGARTWRLRRRQEANEEQGAPPPPPESAHGRFPTFWRTLRDQRVPLLAWGIGISVLGFVTVLIYPPFKDIFKAFDESGALTEFTGAAGAFSEPPGFLASEYFSYIPLIVLIAMIIAGTGAIAGEEGAGTLDLVLAQPISRRRLVVEKSAAYIAVLFGIILLALPGLMLGKLAVDLEIAASHVIWATLTMLPISLFYLSLAILGSAALPGKTSGTILVVGAAIAGYFLNTLGAFVSQLEQARKLSPFYWADFAKPLVGGFDWLNAAAFVGCSLLFLALAVFTLERRDVGSGGPGWRFLRRPQ